MDDKIDLRHMLGLIKKMVIVKAEPAGSVAAALPAVFVFNLLRNSGVRRLILSQDRSWVRGHIFR